MSRKKDEPVISKIEFDEKTAEPVIVNVDNKKLKKQLLKEEALSNAQKKRLEQAKDIAEKHKDIKGKQVMMNKLGFEDKNSESINKRQRVFKNLVSALFFIFVIGVTVYTFVNDFFFSGKKPASFEDILNLLLVNWYYLPCALVALFMCFFLKATKLSLMCKRLTGRAHFWTCFETAIVGHFYNSVTPLAVGGQPFEIYHLAKHGVHGGVASSLPIVTFFQNQLAFVSVSLVSISLINLNQFVGFTSVMPTTITILAIIGIACCFVAPALIFAFSLFPKVGAVMVKFIMFLGTKLRIIKNPKVTTFKTIKNISHNARCIKKVSTSPFVFLATFILSIGEQCAMASIAYFTLKFFGWDLVGVGGFSEWLMILQICFILMSAVSFIPSPGNAGAAELSFYTLFSQAIPIAGFSFPAMLTWRILGFYSFIFIGFIFIRIKKRSDTKLALKQQLEENQSINA